jgi:hypothetical protein
MLDEEEAFRHVNNLMVKFGRNHKHEWQVGFNGRSNGYIVLYSGGVNMEHPHLSRCDTCLRPTWYNKEMSCQRNGCFGTLKLLKEPEGTIFTMPGRSVDQDPEFREWSCEHLVERVGLIREFDKLCDDCVCAFMDMCDNYRAVEKEIMVPVKIKVLEKKE